MTNAAAPKPPRPLSPLRIVCIFLAPFAMAGLLWLAGMAWFAWSFGADQALGLGNIDEPRAIAVFGEHRADCERLRAMLAADLVARDPVAELPHTARWDEYRATLARIGAYGMRRCRREGDGFDLAIDVASYGNFFHCAYVHFVWTDGPPPQDQPPVGDDPDFRRVTPLGNGWYLIYETM
jgi:hypothetical protein